MVIASVLAPFLIIKNVLFKLLFIFNVHILRSEDDCFTITLTPKLKSLFFYQLSFNASDHTIMTSTNHPPRKWTVDLLFKNNRVSKHVTDFKNSPPPFRVDVINVRFLIRNRFLKKWVERLETSKAKYFISFCNTFFYLSRKIKYTW